MRKLTIGVVDFLTKSASKKTYSRFIRANNQSIMPQVVAVWCEELGHEVHMAYFNGPEVLAGGLPDDLDVLFISAFSQHAMLAYALSAFYRSKGAVTVIGGPHPRSYPDDAVKYFDYAVGLCDKALIRDILQEASPHRPLGHALSAQQQPTHLPGARQRWKFQRLIMAEAKLFRVIPIIGSLGCPYTCSFCVDAVVPYQPLDFEALEEDLRFILKHKAPRTLVAWHDPNFGVRFDDYLGLIEEAVPPGSLVFGAESSLALLKEDHCKRLARNGFRIIWPGIETWFDIGGKSKVQSTKGIEKVRRLAAHINMVSSYIPYVQANMILGLDVDEGPEPFELSKRFVDLAPGILPHFSLLMSYGRSAPDNLRYQREERVLNVPFHFLNQLHAMNVRPQNYAWPAFFDHVIDLYAYVFSWPAIAKRFAANRTMMTRLAQLLRGAASERSHSLVNHLRTRQRLKDPATLRYFNGETTALPDFFVDPIRQDLGWLWAWLPEGAIYHDPNAYLHSLNGDATHSVDAHAGMEVA